MRRFKNLDGSVFEDEFGTLTSNAFEVLNHTLSPEYGRLKLFGEAVNLVSKNFEIIEDNRRKSHYSYKREWVIEHFNEVTKMYYELLEWRKKIDYKNKLKNIKNDFQQFCKHYFTQFYNKSIDNIGGFFYILLVKEKEVKYEQ